MSHSASPPQPSALDRLGTALVTGPTSGLGEGFARHLAAAGHDLVLVARNAERLAETAAALRERYGVQVEVLVADLSDRDDLGRVEARLADPDRPVEVLVNNAGYGLKGRFLANSVETEQAHLDVHVVAVMRLCHAALGAMTARGQGAVLNVASVAAFLPRGSYSAAKAYVVRLSQWAHAEYAPQGVVVTAVCPGFVRTEFHARMDVDQSSAPRALWLDADSVVREALADLAAGKALSIPSYRYKVIAGAARLVPTGLLQRFQSFGRR